MYIINELVFGIDAVGRKLEEKFPFIFGNELFVYQDFANTSYHGGSHWLPVYIGIIITSDDQNKNFLKECRAAKEEEYIEEYKTKRAAYVNDLSTTLLPDITAMKAAGELSEEDFVTIDKEIQEYIKFIEETEPEFYNFESSS